MGTFIPDGSDKIYQQDVSFGSSISEALLTKIGAAINYIINNAALKVGGILPSNVLPYNSATSDSSGNLSWSGGGTSVPITNLSVGITTTGRPLHISLIPDGTTNFSLMAVSGGSSPYLKVEFYIDGGFVGNATMSHQSSGGYGMSTPPGAFWTVANPSAAYHVVDARATYSNNIQASYVRLMVREL